MTQPAQPQNGKRARWWKIAQHLDEAQLASVDAMENNNADDPTVIFAFQDAIRQAQAILFEIFRMKGLLPVMPSAAPPVLPAAPPVPLMTAPSPVPPTPVPTVSDDDLAAAGALPLSIGIPSFAQVLPTPSGWPSMADPPPPPPPPVQVKSDVTLPGEPVIASVEVAAEVFDYGADAGKGFENQDAEPKA